MTIQSYLESDGLARFPFVFIVTFGRSGSTLLQGMLNAIDGYCVRGENDGALFHLHRAASGVERVHRVWAKAGVVPTNPMFGADQYRPHELERTLVDAFFKDVLNVPAGTRCCGFKEIRHTIQNMKDDAFEAYMDFVERVFPGAAFIFNIRSVDDASKSNWWGKQNPEHAKKVLYNARRRLENRALKSERSLLFSYDAWMENPDYARRLFDFLGEPYDAGMVRSVLARKHSF
ncbi:sulfotransferase [Oricola sp.]|uniref:sulfotransferase n=1 Tax=Oricola sp. TaxID=1979950 RepID=UPI0025D509BE|nr:sulfotransferase [Oricola sp.]MCI5077437.1 sulfotransferase [Oricola sp.]